jgi:hypothetical protein
LRGTEITNQELGPEQAEIDVKYIDERGSARARVAEWAEYTSNMKGEARSRYESSIKGHIVEAMLMHCFHFCDVEGYRQHLPG